MASPLVTALFALMKVSLVAAAPSTLTKPVHVQLRHAPKLPVAAPDGGRLAPTPPGPAPAPAASDVSGRRKLFAPPKHQCSTARNAKIMAAIEASDDPACQVINAGAEAPTTAEQCECYTSLAPGAIPSCGEWPKTLAMCDTGGSGSGSGPKSSVPGKDMLTLGQVPAAILFLDVEVGPPEQEKTFALQFDTGSGETAVPLSSGPLVSEQIGPRYVPPAGALVKCSSTLCTGGCPWNGNTTQFCDVNTNFLTGGQNLFKGRTPPVTAPLGQCKNYAATAKDFGVNGNKAITRRIRVTSNIGSLLAKGHSNSTAGKYVNSTYDLLLPNPCPKACGPWAWEGHFSSFVLFNMAAKEWWFRVPSSVKRGAYQTVFSAPGTAAAPPVGASSKWTFASEHAVPGLTFSLEWASKGDCCTANGGCFFAQAYQDNMAYLGEEYQDRIGVGGLFAPAGANGLMFGGIEWEAGQNNNLGDNRRPACFRSDGIFGVSPGSNCNPTCKPTVIETLCKANKLPNMFSLCLQGFKGGISSVDIGGVNKNKFGSPLFYLPMLTTRDFSVKAPDSMTIGSAEMSIKLSDFTCAAGQGALFDSGTGTLQVPAAAYDQFIAAFISYAKAHSATAGSIASGMCQKRKPGKPCGYIVPMTKPIVLNDAFPSVNFTWSNGADSFVTSVKPSNYIKVQSSYPDDILSLSISTSPQNCFMMGDVVMSNLYVNFDNEDRRVGLSVSTSCASDGDQKACAGLKTVKECEASGVGCSSAAATIECNQAQFSQTKSPTVGAWVSQSGIVDGVHQGMLKRILQIRKVHD